MIASTIIREQLMRRGNFFGLRNENLMVSLKIPLYFSDGLYYNGPQFSIEITINVSLDARE